MATPLVPSVRLLPASRYLCPWWTGSLRLWVPGDILDTELLKGDREKEPIPETLSDITNVTTKISKEDIQTHVSCIQTQWILLSVTKPISTIRRLKEFRKMSNLWHRSYFQSTAPLGQKEHGGFNSDARHIHIRMHGGGSVCIPEHARIRW